MIKKILFVIAISILFLIPMVSAQEPTVNANGLRKTPWLLFDSELSIEFNQSAVDQAIFTPDGPAVSIPLYISYKVDMPTSILLNPLLRLIFLRTLIISSIQLSVTVFNPPAWASTLITPSSPHINIDTTTKVIEGFLQVAVDFDAPAHPYTLRIKCEAPNIYTIDDTEAYCDITFTPAYLPILNLETNPSPQTPPNQLTIIPISIRNLGNDFTKVTAEIVNIGELNGWIVYVASETYLPLNLSTNVNVTCFCIPPIDFQGNQSIDLRFTPSRWSNPGQTGTPLDIQITAHYP